MTPSADEFARWRDDPVTQWVFAATAKGADENRDAWVQASWTNGVADPALLTELRTRADAYNALSATSYEDWCATHGETPKYD